jgi:SAM-dependent methyltransferase
LVGRADEPSEWLTEHDPLLRALAPGRALDVACGSGRNALHLARLGFEVDAVDISAVAIEHLRTAAAEYDLPIVPKVMDLEDDPLPVAAYEVVVNFNYLQRDLFDSLARALRPGGLLVFETVAQAHIDELGREFNPDYVLARNELLRAFPDLFVLHYREGVVRRGSGERGVASLVAERPGPGPAYSRGRLRVSESTKP